MAGPSLLIKKRLLVILVIFTIAVFVLIGKLAYLQIVQSDELQKMAFEQQNTSRTISPRRGTIYDRNGKELAISASVDTISVRPGELKSSGKDFDLIAQRLAELLEMDKETVYKKITKNSSYEILKRKVEKETGDAIRKWVQEEKIKGINIDEDTKRYYPGRNLAAHIIGFTGADNQGLENGIEIVMEKYLKGVPGKILSEVDARQREIPFNTEKRIEAQDGLNVVLTIDETIQYIVQRELEKAIEDNKVMKGAVGIVMDPRNGDILAMVSKPDFDLNNPYAAPPGYDPETWVGNTAEAVDILRKTVWRNKAVIDTYEPGSTFKAITTAAGLEEGVIKPDTMVNDFPVEVGGWTMSCWRRGRPHGEESFREAVYNSCNPVFVKLALDLGIDKFYGYMKAFGFYDKTGIDLLGEQTGIIHQKPTEVDMAAASFGQRFTITPIQLITAYTAIANDGKLMKPRLVKELTDSEGNIVKKFEPEVIRTVISKQTSETVREILEGVVSEGTGKNAYVKGYRVAGKTGTSQTTEQGVYTASFCSFAPADNPTICVLVALFDPKGESHMGGAIAAPVAGKIIEDTLSYLGVERRYSEKDKEMMIEEVFVPDVRSKTINEAVKSLKEYGLGYKVEGEGNGDSVVVEQTPKPDASIPKNSIVVLYTYKPEEEKMVTVPSVLSKTISEATDTLKNAGLNIKISGTGSAYKQSVAPGETVPAGKVIEVEFRELDNIE
ncbi:MAG TPA: PASTA domain-containing protein [Clostridiaceae bacterium]|nr:PASTA domain-containing protein [Clostridiaceae bacterium]